MSMVAKSKSPQPRGRFITFEGGEGSGKSTQIQLLADRLNAAKLRTITTREPGGSAGAEIVRHLLLSGMAKAFGPETESLLFAAARDDHVSQVIEPALAQGTWVLCDRFTDATFAYQGGGRGLGIDINPSTAGHFTCPEAIWNAALWWNHYYKGVGHEAADPAAVGPRGLYTRDPFITLID